MVLWGEKGQMVLGDTYRYILFGWNLFNLLTLGGYSVEKNTLCSLYLVWLFVVETKLESVFYFQLASDSWQWNHRYWFLAYLKQKSRNCRLSFQYSMACPRFQFPKRQQIPPFCPLLISPPNPAFLIRWFTFSLLVGYVTLPETNSKFEPENWWQAKED